jgi:hypothetical protein
VLLGYPARATRRAAEAITLARCDMRHRWSKPLGKSASPR